MPDPQLLRTMPLLAGSPALRALPPAARYLLRGGPAVREAAGAALAVAVPATPCRAGTAGERAALWLGPDEWLLLAPPTCATDLETRLTTALERLPHSLVDVSHRQIALEVSGPEAESLLAAGCPLDLDASAFPAGACTRTVLAKAEVVLWRTGEHRFRLEVARSFARYVSQFLVAAERGII